MRLYKRYWKIIFSMILSFMTVFFVIPFFMTPGKITRTAANYANFLTGLDLSIPTKLFTLNFDQTERVGIKPTPTTADYQNNYFNYPTSGPQPTKGLINQTPTLPAVVLTKAGPIPNDDELVDFPFESGDINNLPGGYPTNPPKPTKRPKPSPTPLAPPEYLRPGTGLEDIFKKAGELACVPPALLKAFVAQEAPGVLNWSDDQALFYNAYDWWHRVKEVKQVCAGYGFYTHTGLVAEDSLFAGEKCKDPFSAETANDTYSKVLGSCQMLQSYWEKDYKEPTRQKLKVSKVDRRVLIDCLVGYGIHFRNDTGYSGSCSGDWEMKYVAKAACVNAGGSCDQYNYCTLICNNYNKFANKNYSCASAAGLFVSGSFCQFK